MAKIVLIADTHYGVRNDNVNYYNYFAKFFDKVFFPYLKKNKIDKVVHLGDVVDRRKYINFLTAHNLRKTFLQPLEDMGMEMDIIVGNHDTFYKNTNQINAIDEVVRRYKNINFYKDPEEVDLFGVQTLYLPWICKDNHKQSMDMIKLSESRLCIGHLEIEGFTMHPGQLSKEGLSSSIFKKFEKTLSGHFHHRSDSNGIYYLGCPYQMNWSDYSYVKGFHVLDTETLELTFVENPYDIYTKYIVEGSGKYKKKPLKEEDVKDHYIRVVVKEKVDVEEFDDFIGEIESFSPLEVKIVDETMIYQERSSDVDLDNIENTREIMDRYVDMIETDVDLDKLKKKIHDIYYKAMNAE